jgi:DNA-binding transcriptional MocR family regulator
MKIASSSNGLRNQQVDAAASAAVAEEVRKVEASVVREILESSRSQGVISLAGGMPAQDLFDVEGLQSAAAAVIDNAGATREALEYGTTEGNDELRGRIASLMEERDVKEIDEELVVITTGASQGIDLACRALLNPGDTIAVEKPTFLAALSAAQLCEANIVEIPIDQDGIRVDELERLLIEHHPVKALYTMPTFSNPSGAMLSLERRHRLLELAREREVVVVEDDAYGSLWFDEPPPPSLLSIAQGLAHPPVCIHMSTFSKIVAPGLRLGWIIAPPSLLERIVVVKQIADVHSSSLDQAIVVEYLKGGRLPVHVEHVRRSYAKRSRWLTEALRQELPDDFLEFSLPRGGMFLWCRLTGGTAEAVAQNALKKKVAVVPGNPFFSTPPTEQYLRLSFSKLTENEAIKAARRLAATIGASS